MRRTGIEPRFSGALGYHTAVGKPEGEMGPEQGPEKKH